MSSVKGAFTEEPLSFPCEISVLFSIIMFCCTLVHPAFILASLARGCSSLVFPMRCINSPSGLSAHQLAEQLLLGVIARGFLWLNLYRYEEGYSGCGALSNLIFI